jgi:hypothetical protein
MTRRKKPCGVFFAYFRPSSNHSDSKKPPAFSIYNGRMAAIETDDQRTVSKRKRARQGRRVFPMIFGLFQEGSRQNLKHYSLLCCTDNPREQIKVFSSYVVSELFADRLGFFLGFPEYLDKKRR